MTTISGLYPPQYSIGFLVESQFDPVMTGPPLTPIPGSRYCTSVPQPTPLHRE